MCRLNLDSSLSYLWERTRSVDERVQTSFRQHLQQLLPSDFSILAVGGYGRNEQFPHSDVDLLFLSAKAEPTAQQREAISSFLRDLWDSGLRASHSLRTIEDCCTLHEGNLELTISLLDQRLVAGDKALHARLVPRLETFLKSKSNLVARELVAKTRARHQQFQGTIYHLEPNVKESPGCLRDLQVVRWLSRLLEKTPSPAIADAFEFLASIRRQLHERHGRDNNILNFESQDALSSSPENLMRDFYRHARFVFRSVTRLMDPVESKDRALLSHFRDFRSRVSTSEFTVSREMILARSPQLLASDSGLILRLFQFIGRHGFRMAPDTEQRLEAFPSQPAALTWKDVKEILNLPQASKALRAMHETGVLGKLFPEWSEIECLVVRDFYHRYTVDEHTIVAIENASAPTDSRFQALLSEIGRPDLLRLALVFHDIGKGDGDHVVESAKIARKVMDRWKAPAEDRETVAFLVEQHLTLSAVMNKRDLTDPTTADELSERIGTIERLKLLTLLTYADIGAVFPGALTPWRLEQLWRTYCLAAEKLTRELESDRIHDAEGRSQEEAAFLEGLPARYLKTHTAAEIANHMTMALEAKEKGAAATVERADDAWRVAVVSSDRPFLFASLAGALAGSGLNIVKAEAFSNAQGQVVDTFAVEDAHRNLELNPEEVIRLRKTLVKVALGEKDAQTMLRSRPKPSGWRASLNPRVRFDNRAATGATLIEIVAEDRPGLLFELATALSRSGCDIDVVLIDTEAHQALDVFYVRYSGGRLPEDLHAPLREQLLSICSVT